MPLELSWLTGNSKKERNGKKELRIILISNCLHTHALADTYIHTHRISDL
jgi:hypothetical protein